MKVKFSSVFFILSLFFSLHVFISSVQAGDVPRLIINESGDTPYSATIYTTGIGEMPEASDISYEQKKIFGRRAAIVDGYRNLVTAIQGARRYLTEEGSEIFIIEGYLQNVEILETRYLRNGMVEVDLMVMVKVYDPSIAEDKTILNILTGKTSTALEGIEIIEVDETPETIQDSRKILEDIKTSKAD